MFKLNYKVVLTFTFLLAVFVLVNDFYYNRFGQAMVDEPLLALSKAESPQEFALTLIVTPSKARIRIMNIKPLYQPGMLLPAGRYDIEVSSPGYNTQRFWLQHNKPIRKKIVLEP